jgi:chromosome transmission fidelity protein 18
MEVCKKESLRASIPALTALCDKADNDIRSCLNTLQFLKRRMTEITVSAVQSASIGQKDTQKNLFTLWKDIFQLPTVKKQSMILRRSQKEISKSDRFLYILYNVMSVGVVDKVLQGVFENYPSMRYRDPSMKMTSNVLEWMAFQDVVDRIMMSTQNYTLMPYLPFASVAAHIYLASSANAKVHYPHQQYEVIQNIQRSNNIIESLFSDMPPKTRNFMTKRNLTVEILPLVVETLSPTLRPVSVQLYSAKEKQLLSDLVATMISFNVNYHQERNIEGQYVYSVEPNIDLLVRFPGLPQRRQLTYAAKQLIAREVEMEKMRRAEQVLHKGQPPAEEDKDPHTKYTSMLQSSTPKRAPVTVSDMVQTERTPARMRKRKAAMDFFTRATGNKQKKRKDLSSAKEDSRSGSIRHPLWFRYNEGFLNAVRRPVKIQDLL